MNRNALLIKKVVNLLWKKTQGAYCIKLEKFEYLSFWNNNRMHIKYVVWVETGRSLCKFNICVTGHGTKIFNLSQSSIYTRLAQNFFDLSHTRKLFQILFLTYAH